MKNNRFIKTNAILIEHIIQLEKYFINQKAPLDFLNYCSSSLKELKARALNSFTLNETKVIASEIIKIEELTPCVKNKELNYALSLFLEETLESFIDIKKYVFIPGSNFYKENKNCLKNHKEFIFLSNFFNESPSYWSLLLKDIIKISDKKNLKPDQFNDCDGFKSLFDDIFSDIVSLKLIGPAFYLNFVSLNTLKALLTKDNEELKSLFLRNRFLYKNIKLTEAITTISPYYEEFNLLLRALANKELLETFEKIENCSKDLIDNVGEKINESLDNKAVFNNEDYKLSLKALNTLSQNCFISSYQNNEIGKIKEEYEKSQTASDIYNCLNKIKEKPFKLTHIINAVVIYRYKKIESALKDKNIELLTEIIDNIDEIAVKSIEINKIHKILLKEE